MTESCALLALLPGMPGWGELLVIAFIGLLLFGRRLPEVARSLGQSVVEFKRGMQGFKNDMNNSAQLPPNAHAHTPSTALPDQGAHTPPAATSSTGKPVE